MTYFIPNFKPLNITGGTGMQGMPPGAGGGGPNQQGGNFFGGNGPPMGAPSGGAMGST